MMSAELSATRYHIILTLEGQQVSIDLNSAETQISGTQARHELLEGLG